MSTTDPTGTPLEALVRDWVSLYVSNLYERSSDLAEDFAYLRERVIARCASLNIEVTPAITGAVPDWPTTYEPDHSAEDCYHPDHLSEPHQQVTADDIRNLSTTQAQPQGA